MESVRKFWNKFLDLNVQKYLFGVVCLCMSADFAFTEWELRKLYHVEAYSINDVVQIMKLERQSILAFLLLILFWVLFCIASAAQEHLNILKRRANVEQ